MAGTWNVVTFNEGAPFDPNDLNQLQLNLTDVFTKSTNLLKPDEIACPMFIACFYLLQFFVHRTLSTF